MKLNRKTLLHAALCSLLLFTILTLLSILNYIDISVVKLVYLPIYAVVIGAIMFRQYIFGYIFTAAACLGLILEYITHLRQPDPTMSGAFLNTLVVALGFFVAIIVQIIVSKTKKEQ